MRTPVAPVALVARVAPVALVARVAPVALVARVAPVALVARVAPVALVALVALVAPAFSQPIASVSPTSIELGRVGPVRVDTSIVIVNRGSDTLRLERLATSCGCTSAQLERTALAPGESVRVGVSIDARNRTGEVRSSVTVLSNDPASPGTVVSVHGTVARAVSMQEFLGPAANATLGVPHELVLQVRNVSDAPLRLGEPAAEKVDGIEIGRTFEAIVLEPGESRSIPIAVTPRKSGTGSAVLTIPTDSPLQPQLAVGIYTATGR